MKLTLIDLLRRQHDYSWDKETWFLPLADVLEGLSAADAAWRPPGGGNTIWQTVNHLNYYNDRLIGQIKGIPTGKGLPNNLATFGEPGNVEDAQGWQSTLEEVRRIGEELRVALAEVKDSDLKEEYADGLAMQIMHTVHHTGQIILIRKLQGSWPQERE